MNLILVILILFIFAGVFVFSMITYEFIKNLSYRSFAIVIPISFIIYFLQMFYYAFTRIPISINTIISSIVIAILIFLAINYNLILEKLVKLKT